VNLCKLASFRTIGHPARLALFDTQTAGQIGFVSHVRPVRRHVRPSRGKLASFCIIDSPDLSRASQIGFVCTAVFRPTTAYRLPATAFWARMAQMKAWNSYSIGGIVALRCLKKPANKMSRRCGPEIPARPSAVTKTDPLAKTRRAPRRQDSDALTLIRRRFSMPVCYTKI
jgi:hypothetical protein